MLQALDKWILSFRRSAGNIFIAVHSFMYSKSLSWYTDNVTRRLNKNLNTLTEILRYQQTVSYRSTANAIYFRLYTLQWKDCVPYSGQQREIPPVTAWLISGVWIKPFPPPRVFSWRPLESCGKGLIVMMDLTFLFSLSLPPQGFYSIGLKRQYIKKITRRGG